MGRKPLFYTLLQPKNQFINTHVEKYRGDCRKKIKNERITPQYWYIFVGN